jgi:DNA-binding GntR family transcriptional regulator
VATEFFTDTQTVVTELRDAISRGELVPNQRLIEQDICAAYGASRATVRAALAELTTEGLVERIQNRGARVRAVPVSEAIEILEVRAALEAMCAAQATAQLTDEERQILLALGDDMRRAIEIGDLYQYSELNNRLHEAVLEFSQHGTASAIIHRLKGQVVRHQFRLNLRSGGPAGSLAEHLEIIAAICAGNAAQAEEAMKKHLDNVADALRARPIEGPDRSSP